MSAIHLRYALSDNDRFIRSSPHVYRFKSVAITRDGSRLTDRAIADRFAVAADGENPEAFHRLTIPSPPSMPPNCE